MMFMLVCQVYFRFMHLCEGRESRDVGAKEEYNVYDEIERDICITDITNTGNEDAVSTNQDSLLDAQMGIPDANQGLNSLMVGLLNINIYNTTTNNKTANSAQSFTSDIKNETRY